MAFGDPSDSFAVTANSFIQAIARSPLSTGMMGMGSSGGAFNLAGIMGITDPGAAIALNQILQPLLMKVTGQKYTPAQFSGGMNIYSQGKVSRALIDQGRAEKMALAEDQLGIYNMMEGTSKLMGQKFGKNERRAASQFAQTMSEALPTLSQYAPDLVEGFFGEKGSATVMAQNMFKGGRYAVDPVTGRRGYSGDSAGEITKGVYKRLYGANADISEMSGLTAGKAGAMFDEMQRRGLMPNSSSSRGKNLQGIAEQLGTTVADVSKLPDLDSKLREFDASKISERLKGMSKAVSAMQEVFGEMGEPNAPMTQLVGAIETLTQSSMQGMTPIEMEKMIRNTANTAKVAGIEMPEMFRQMGVTAGMADAAGVNRALVPGITNQAILENQAAKNRFGGAKAFGMLSSDSLLNLQEQLGVQASKDDSTHDMASVIRAVEVYGHTPEKGSEFEAVYKALKDKGSGGEYEYKGEKKNVYSLTRREGGVQGFLAKEGKVSTAELNSLQYNREANSRIIAENDLGTNIGRANQNLRMVEDLARYSSTTVAQVSADKDLMGGTSTSFQGTLEGDQNSLDISRVASEALINVEPGKVGAEKAPGVVAAALTKHFASKGVKIGEAEKKAIAKMSAGIAEGSEKFATTRGMIGGTVTMQQLASKELFRESQATKAEVEIDTAFQQKFRSEGKQGLMSRVSDFVRKGNKDTTFNDFIATTLNYQPAGPMADKLKEDFDKLKEAKKNFDTVDEGKARADYFQTAIANASTEEEKKAIMEEMVSSNFATEKSKEKEYARFAELGRRNSKGENEQLKNSFKERNGISMEEMKGKTGQEVRNIQKTHYLNETERLAQRLNVSLKVSGATFKGGSRETELNKSISELSETDNGANGVDRYERFLEKYSLDSELYAKGGKEGETIKQNSLDSIDRLNNYANSLNLTKDELIDASQEGFSVMNLDQLTAINKQEVDALETMSNKSAYAGAQVRNKEQLEISKTELARLEKDSPADKSAIAKQRAEVKMRQGLVDTKQDKVSDKLIAAKKTQTALYDPDKQEAIQASFAALKDADLMIADSESAVEDFAKEIKASRKDLSQTTIKDTKDLRDLLVPTSAELEYVAKRRALLVDETDPAKIAKLEREISDKIKQTQASPDKFKMVTDVDKVEAVLNKIKDLNPEEKAFLQRHDSDLNEAYNKSEEQFSYTDKKELEDLDKIETPLTKEQASKKAALLKKEEAAEAAYDKQFSYEDDKQLAAIQETTTKLTDEQKTQRKGLLEKQDKALAAYDEEFSATNKKELADLDKIGSSRTEEQTARRAALLDKQKTAKETYAAAKGDDKTKADYANLRDRDAKKLTPEEQKTLAVAEKQLGLDSGQGKTRTPGELTKIAEDRDKRAGDDIKFNDRVKELIDQKQSAEDAKRTALKELGDQDAKMVTAIGGIEGLKLITDSEKVSLARDAAELDIALQDQNTPLSATMSKAIEASGKLRSGSSNNGATENLTNFFKDTLGANLSSEDKDKLGATYQKDRKAGDKLASSLNLGAASASDLAGGGKEGRAATPAEKMKELKSLLDKDDTDASLSTSQKSLKKSLKTQGITKEIFDKDGNVDVDKFNKAAETISQKKKEEDTANARKEASADKIMGLDDRTIKALSNKELVLSGNITIEGDLSGTANPKVSC